MTTLAYKDGIIATDGQVTCGRVILTKDQSKRHFHGDNIFFLCGPNSDMEAFMNAYPQGTVKNSTVSGFALVDGVLHATVADSGEVCTWVQNLESAWAYGSGSEFALGAMDAGCNAEDAVRIAAGRDVGTGGKIRLYNATSGEEL